MNYHYKEVNQMRLFAIGFMMTALLSLGVGMVLRLLARQLMSIPPQSFLEFTIACLLFSIALSVFSLSGKRE